MAPAGLWVGVRRQLHLPPHPRRAAPGAPSGTRAPWDSSAEALVGGGGGLLLQLLLQEALVRRWLWQCPAGTERPGGAGASSGPTPWWAPDQPGEGVAWPGWGPWSAPAGQGKLTIHFRSQTPSPSQVCDGDRGVEKRRGPSRVTGWGWGMAGPGPRWACPGRLLHPPGLGDLRPAALGDP